MAQTQETEAKMVTREYEWDHKTKNMVQYAETNPKGSRLLPTPYMATDTMLQQWGRLPKGFRITFEPIFDD